MNVTGIFGIEAVFAFVDVPVVNIHSLSCTCDKGSKLIYRCVPFLKLPKSQKEQTLIETPPKPDAFH